MPDEVPRANAGDAAVGGSRLQRLSAARCPVVALLRSRAGRPEDLLRAGVDLGAVKGL